MGAKRIEYQIVGRYMSGKEVVAYHLQSLESGKSGRYTRDQVAYLVGRGQVTNCECQIYNDKLLYRGKGVSLDDLPVQQEDGELSRTNNVGKVRRGASAGQTMEQCLIVGVITSGRNVVGYKIRNAGGAVVSIPRDKLLVAARNGQIGNARVQMWQGKMVLKGVNCDLSQLPRQDVNQVQN